MGALAFAAMVFLAAAAVAVWRWQRHDESPRFVLRLMPAALLFAVAPVPLGALGVMRGFQGIADTGVGGLPAVVPFLRGVIQPLLVGSLLCVVGLAVAAALEAFATGVVHADEEPADAERPPGDRLETWLLAGAAALVVPAAMLAAHARDTVTFVVQIGVALTGATAVIPIVDARQTSATIADRLVLSLLAGATFTLLLVLLTVAMAIYARSRPAPRWLTACTWVAAGAGLSLAVAGAYLLAVDLRTLDDLVK